jgi:hypothetical protein
VIGLSNVPLPLLGNIFKDATLASLTIERMRSALPPSSDPPVELGSGFAIRS